MVIGYEQHVCHTTANNGLLHAVENWAASIEQELGIATCLSHDHSLNRLVDMPSLFIARSGQRIVGVATIFAPDEGRGEIAIAVQPEYTRKGIGTTLLRMASDALASQSVSGRLLICDRKSSDGMHFALHHARRELFREYGMQLDRLPEIPDEPVLSIRLARMDDMPDMVFLCAAAYGDDPDQARTFIEASMISVNRTGYIGCFDDQPVAMCFISEHEHSRSVNTVAVAPQWQRRGFAKEFLLRILHGLPSDGKPVDLDVNSTNDKAFSLYRRLGFEIVSDIGYYEM